MKKYFILLLLVCFSCFLSGCDIHDFLPERSEPFSLEELQSYLHKNFAIGKIEYVNDYYGAIDTTPLEDQTVKGDLEEYHYYVFHELNDRGLTFTVVDMREYDEIDRKDHYYVRTNYDQLVLQHYLSSHSLPDGMSLTNQDGEYPAFRIIPFGKSQKITFSFINEEDYRDKIDRIYHFLTLYNGENQTITGSNYDLNVPLYINNKINHTAFDVYVTHLDSFGDQECSFANFRSCVKHLKNNIKK